MTFDHVLIGLLAFFGAVLGFFYILTRN